MRGLVVAACALLVGCGGGGDGGGNDGGGGGGPDAAPGEVVTVDEIIDHGVTWRFESPVEAGRFVTGDWYVIGAVTVVEIDPAPGGGRNGSVLNLPPEDSRTGFDDRTVEGRYDAALSAALPIAMVPGDRLVSSISVEAPGQVEAWLREGSGEASLSPVASVSVLTCLAEAAPADALRPSYADPEVRIYRMGDASWDLVPEVAAPAEFDAALLGEVADRMMRPWVDNLYFGFDAQIDTMPTYGREMGRVAGMAGLFLMLDLEGAAAEAQERLRIGFLQRGIDLVGLVRAGHPGWHAFGGHGSGRKWPIVFAGVVLGDGEMAAVSASFPETHFGEDMHTAYTADLGLANAWTGDPVIYTGHLGVLDGEAVSDDPAWGPYEQLQPADWLDRIGEDYRRCCTSIAWAGQALGARLLGAEEVWGHPAFFAYVDRWMDPAGDDADTAAILEQTGWDYTADWQSEGQAWDVFVDAMWAAYR